jgi:hypothetical protein
MKRLALAATVLAVVTACSKSEPAKADSAAPAMAPAAAAPAMAPMDTGAMKAMAADSARKADSVKAAASMKKPPAKKGGI